MKVYMVYFYKDPEPPKLCAIFSETKKAEHYIDFQKLKEYYYVKSYVLDDTNQWVF